MSYIWNIYCIPWCVINSGHDCLPKVPEKTFGSSRWHFGILTATLGLPAQRF